MLDTDYTSPTYDSYSDLPTMEDAISNVGLLLDNTFWGTLDEPTKEGLIKLATRDINKYDWKGEQNAAIIVASMLWPRTDIDNVGDTEIPYDLILRMACWISHNARQSTLGQTGAIESKSVGEVSVSYSTSNVGNVNQNDPCSDYGSEYMESNTSFGGVGSVSKRRGP